MDIIKTLCCVKCGTVYSADWKCRCGMIFAEPYSEEYAEGWNAVIEAAAEKADERGLIGMKEIAAEIRKLKI